MYSSKKIQRKFWFSQFREILLSKDSNSRRKANEWLFSAFCCGFLSSERFDQLAKILINHIFEYEIPF